MPNNMEKELSKVFGKIKQSNMGSNVNIINVENPQPALPIKNNRVEVLTVPDRAYEKKLEKSNKRYERLLHGMAERDAQRTSLFAQWFPNMNRFFRWVHEKKERKDNALYRKQMRHWNESIWYSNLEISGRAKHALKQGQKQLALTGDVLKSNDVQKVIATRREKLAEKEYDLLDANTGETVSVLADLRAEESEANEYLGLANIAFAGMIEHLSKIRYAEEHTHEELVEHYRKEDARYKEQVRRAVSELPNIKPKPKPTKPENVSDEAWHIFKLLGVNAKKHGLSPENIDDEMRRTEAEIMKTGGPMTQLLTVAEKIVNREILHDELGQFGDRFGGIMGYTREERFEARKEEREERKDEKKHRQSMRNVWDKIKAFGQDGKSNIFSMLQNFLPMILTPLKFLASPKGLLIGAISTLAVASLGMAIENGLRTLQIGKLIGEGIGGWWKNKKSGEKVLDLKEKQNEKIRKNIDVKKIHEAYEKDKIGTLKKLNRAEITALRDWYRSGKDIDTGNAVASKLAGRKKFGSKWRASLQRDLSKNLRLSGVDTDTNDFRYLKPGEMKAYLEGGGPMNEAIKRQNSGKSMKHDTNTMMNALAEGLEREKKEKAKALREGKGKDKGTAPAAVIQNNTNVNNSNQTINNPSGPVTNPDRQRINSYRRGYFTP